MNRRFTVRPYRVGDREIPAGATVLANLAAANRDELFWGADAELLRLNRENARSHLSFGGGIHYCIGGSLARTQGRLAIGELARRFPGLRLDGEVSWNGSLGLRGPARLPVRV
jgi:cytochrome P450